MGLLEETAFTLQEGHGTIAIVLDGLDLDFAATHVSCGREISRRRR